MRAAIGDRLAEVGLELHPGKTKVAYCKDGRRRGSHEVISFTFLGYTFRPRKAFDKTRHRAFTGFLPGVSAEKLTEMSRKARAWKLNRRTTLTLAELARAINPVLAGSPGAARPVAWRRLNEAVGRVIRRVSSGVVLVAGSCSCSSARDRGIRDAGFPGEVAVWGEVLDGSG